MFSGFACQLVNLRRKSQDACRHGLKRCAMIAPQTGACFGRGRSGLGDARVHAVSNRCGALAALLAAVALCGCSGDLFERSAWFQKRPDFFGREGGYTYSELQETKQKPITANDLISPNGACPSRPMPPQMQPAVAVPAAPNNPNAPSAVATSADPLLGEGVALGMSECDVVERAGEPASIQIGRNPNGDRTALLTYQSGPRPGIYRFERGRLTEINELDNPPPPPQTAKKKPRKKKPPQQSS
jgi:hypothetical protein